MKYLFLLLAFLPLSAQSQPSANKTSASNTEIGFSLGYARDNSADLYYYDSKQWHGGLVSAISLIQNKGNLQYGLKVLVGLNSSNLWYVAPALLLNRKFSVKNSYFYTGAMAGYTCANYWPGDDPYRGGKTNNGYIFGIQAGYVTPMGKRLAFTTELAVHSTQLWVKYTDYESYSTYPYLQTQYRPVERTASYFNLYFPLTVGLRYRI